MAEPPPDVWRRLAQHYLWESLVTRANGEFSNELLRYVAMRTASEVPCFVDPVASTEWHIARVLDVARQMVTQDATPVSLPSSLLAGTMREAGYGVLSYEADQADIAHPVRAHQARDYLMAVMIASPDHPGIAVCRTVLPATVCACGRYLLLMAGAWPS